MGTSRLFHIFVLLGSAFMILLIILYWTEVGASRQYLHTPVSPGPKMTNGAQQQQPQQQQQQQQAQTPQIPSFLSDIDAFVNQFLEPGTGEPTDPVPAESSNQSEKAEERYVPRQEWKIHLTPVAAELRQRQEYRQRLLKELCANDSLMFPGKKRSFDDIPNKELDHLIVDDRHGVIYCYVPKVACTNWKRIMIVLSESLLHDGVPQRDPMVIPRELAHNGSMHFTFNKFWKRYGKFARHLMKVKLKKYTKFLFVRDPFLRLISAYRDKFQLRNEDFYRRFGKVMLQRYANQPTPPESVDQAFAAGAHPSFSHFIQYLLDPQTEKDSPFNEHWQQVYRLCHPCQIQYDFVGHLETAEEDAEHLLRLLRVDNVVEFPTSHRNVTASDSESDWFGTVPLEVRRELYKLYEPDFRLFGYNRPDPILNE
ncbi:carbohydrate sulfotransferase 12-like [Syngnathus typhle]|uniref:carbohydrate sulfotransferase 12-like n=1 Tax=Syngnathus typhle TaxID=161592 RepID=UPI002A69C4C8|nr:carbohydrate sulfotransferase 12-like [Syngnathus typhle]XP_061158954.1 carbohydrate sulfotransferase 12-like [Syngnathus typhle]